MANILITKSDGGFLSFITIFRSLMRNNQLARFRPKAEISIIRPAQANIPFTQSPCFDLQPVARTITSSAKNIILNTNDKLIITSHSNTKRCFNPIVLAKFRVMIIDIINAISAITIIT
jgi:hypothetical protein